MPRTLLGRTQVYRGVWASRPAASAVPVGSSMVVTDVGVGGYSEWVSDGTYWRPVGGSVVLLDQMATTSAGAIAPLATVSGVTVETFFTVAGLPFITPPGIFWDGCMLSMSYMVRCAAGLTAAATVRLRVNDNATVSTGPDLYGQGMSIGNRIVSTHFAGLIFRAQTEPVSQIVRYGWNTVTGSGTADGIAAASVKSYNTNGMWIHPSVTPGVVGDTIELIRFRIELGGL